MRFAVVVALLLLEACGSSHQPATPDDAIMRQNAHAAGLALSLERPNEAIEKYKQALERARARDDATAIGDYGYDIAVAQLVANEPKQALDTIRATRRELALRVATSFPAMDLAEATACYRVGDKATSDKLAAQVEASAEPVTAARASFLRGLIAADVGNTAGLNRAIARLASPTSPNQQADEDELLARRELAQGAFASAVEQAERSAELRRQERDYRDMARVLALAADAQARAGRADLAAALYIRAGRSAAAQGNVDAARSWLHRAMELGSDATLHREAQSAIDTIGHGVSAR
jgi:hypothetical protein